MTNQSIAQTFGLLGDLMELHGENPFKARAYSSAAFNIKNLNVDIKDLSLEELATIKGIGQAISAKIRTLIETAHLPILEELLQKTPEGIIEMLNIKGLGTKKIRIIWKELNIENIGELLYGCNENRLALLKGFGTKTQETVKKNIEFYLANKAHFHYAKLEQEALELAEHIQEQLKTSLISLTGAIRRKCPVIDKIELVVGINDISVLEKAWDALSLSLENRANNTWAGKTANGHPVSIYIATAQNYYRRLFETTASQEHLRQFKALEGADASSAPNSEAAIYESAGLNYIEPELREGREEINRVDTIPKLVELADIKGILHNHSTYSDGKNTLEEMALACKEMGYEYLGISDHSKSAFYAGGLKQEEIICQHQKIDELNKNLSPFKIFKGIESDILFDGSLDYEEPVLKSFDFIIGSIHSVLKMNEEKATQRLITAIENPYITILGHLTGRLLLYREGYPIDHKKVIDACATNNVIIELNANPYRLDLDWTWIGYALSKGVKISINPDAHNIAGIANVHYGICVARKGGLNSTMTFNCLSVAEIEDYFAKRKIR